MDVVYLSPDAGEPCSVVGGVGVGNQSLTMVGAVLLNT